MNNKSINKSDLKNIAVLVRDTAKELSDSCSFRSCNYWNFPRACCGLTSWTLAWVLHDLYPHERVLYVEAERDYGSHAWVEIGGYCIDLTSSQFDDCSNDIVFAKKGSSKFLNTFSVLSCTDVDGTEGKISDDELLYNTVKQRICKRMNNT